MKYQYRDSLQPVSHTTKKKYTHELHNPAFAVGSNPHVSTLCLFTKAITTTTGKNKGP